MPLLRASWFGRLRRSLSAVGVKREGTQREVHSPEDCAGLSAKTKLDPSANTAEGGSVGMEGSQTKLCHSSVKDPASSESKLGGWLKRQRQQWRLRRASSGPSALGEGEGRSPIK